MYSQHNWTATIGTSLSKPHLLLLLDEMYVCTFVPYVIGVCSVYVQTCMRWLAKRADCDTSDPLGQSHQPQHTYRCTYICTVETKLDIEYTSVGLAYTSPINKRVYKDSTESMQRFIEPLLQRIYRTITTLKLHMCILE